MQKYISLLRGVNVSGHKKILMADLKALYEGLGFEQIKTYIQSGNVIFEAENDDNLAAKIEKAILVKYGFEVPVTIILQTDLGTIMSNNPFLNQANVDVEKLHIMFLSATPDAILHQKIEAISYAPDEFIINENVVYLHCPINYGNSKLTNTFFESKLKLKATTRNLKTCQVLSEI